MPSHLIIGGISSGKSLFAETLAKGIYDDNANAGLYYIATAPILDDEMINKIETHKKRRSKQWITIEEQIDIFEKIRLSGIYIFYICLPPKINIVWNTI